MTAKKLASALEYRHFPKKTFKSSKLTREHRRYYFKVCIEEIAKQMYQDIKDSDIDLDYKAMNVVLYKIGEKLVKK